MPPVVLLSSFSFPAENDTSKCVKKYKFSKYVAEFFLPGFLPRTDEERPASSKFVSF